MYGHFKQVSPALLDQLRRDPSMVEPVLTAAHPGLATLRSILSSDLRERLSTEQTRRMRERMANMQEMQHTALFQVTQRLGAESASAVAEASAPGVSVEKEWHAIHFLLTGCVAGGEGALALAVFGGEEIGDDLGHGPARYLAPDEVRTVSEALSRIDEQEFRARFDAARLDAFDVYPGGWLEDPELADEYAGATVDAFIALREYYHDAASNGNAMLLYIA